MPNVHSPQKIHRPRRRWFSFSLRSLLVVMFLVAALFAWLGKYVIRSRTERPVVAQLRAAGGLVQYDYQLSLSGLDPSHQPNGSSFIRNLFGEDFYGTVIFVSFKGPIGDDDIQNLGRLKNLEGVSISGPEVTDKCIDELLLLEKLRTLSLSDTHITPTRIGSPFNLKIAAMS